MYWFATIKSLSQQDSKLDYRFIPHDGINSFDTDYSDPNNYTSSTFEIFKSYVTQIDEFQDEHFDLILIDGRARPSCIQHSVNKLKRNGLLVLDNADRVYYLSQTKNLLSDFDRIICQGATAGIFDRTVTHLYRRQTQSINHGRK